MTKPPEFRYEINGIRIQRICRETPASEDDHLLVARIMEALPALEVRIARRGHIWYRIGGVVTPEGERIALDINEWAERSLIECGHDFEILLDHCIEQNFLVTRHVGVSLYLSVKTGPRPQDFVQIEVDRTQERTFRTLIDAERLPEDLEELIDPIEPSTLEPWDISSPQYIYRRKTDVAVFMEELSKHRSTIHPAQHFMKDWEASSAMDQATFCHHWSLRLHRRIGRHGEQHLNVEVVANSPQGLSRLDSAEGKRGKALSALITQYDHLAGYPFAWFFNMVGGSVSPQVGESVWRDISGDFAYLPSRDAQILARWVCRPYYLS